MEEGNLVEQHDGAPLSGGGNFSPCKDPLPESRQR